MLTLMEAVHYGIASGELATLALWHANMYRKEDLGEYSMAAVGGPYPMQSAEHASG